MSAKEKQASRVVAAVHGRKTLAPELEFVPGLADALREAYDIKGLVELYQRFSAGDGFIDATMRRTIWRALALRCGPGLQVGVNAEQAVHGDAEHRHPRAQCTHEDRSSPR